MLQFLLLSIVAFSTLVEFSYAEKKLKNQIILIRADLINANLEEQSSSVDVILIENTVLEKKENVIDVLRSVPGVEIFNQGGPGKVSKVFLRGTNSEHTLVLIDGIEVNDPMSPGRAFDFAHTDLNNIERIEVIKGPQSVSYGSDALGGVINIITKQGSGPFQSIMKLEGGSYGSHKIALGASSGETKNKYTLVVAKKSADGFSVANKKDGNNEKDGYQQLDVTTKLNNELTDRLNSEIVIKYVDAESELDRNGGPGADDPNANEFIKQFFSKWELKSFFFDDKLESSITLNYSQTYRKNKNKPDLDDTTLKDDFFKGFQLKAQLKNKYYIDEKSIIGFGIEYESEVGKSNRVLEKDAQAIAFFTRYKKQWSSLFMGFGLRHDEHSEGNIKATTYQFNSGYLFRNTGTKFLVSLATGFKNPSLFQLYDPLFGNTKLSPEEVISWDAGLAQSFFNEKLKLNLTYFENNFKNLIAFDPLDTRSMNLGKSKIRGLEAGVQSHWGPDIVLNLGTSHLFQFENTQKNEKLIRRSKNNITSSLNFSATEKIVISLDYRYVGSRTDFEAVTFNKVKAPDFDVVDLTLDYSFKGDNHIFIKFNNLFNRNYEEIDGFGTARFSFYTGINLKL